MIILILMAGVGIVGIKFSTGTFSNVYVLHAVFDHTGHGLDDSSTVKIRGVNVGKVSTIKLLPDGHADVSIRVQRRVKVPTSTAVSAEPLSVFGPLYINIDPGPNEARGPFLAPGGHIAETTSPIELTDILNRVSPLLTAVDPQDLVTIFHNIAAGLDGLGPDHGSHDRQQLQAGRHARPSVAQRPSIPGRLGHPHERVFRPRPSHGVELPGPQRGASRHGVAGLTRLASCSMPRPGCQAISRT